MYSGRSSAPININFSCPRHTSAMNTGVPQAFGAHRQLNSNGPLHPHFNPSQQMYPGHHVHNQGFSVHHSSVIDNVPLFYPPSSGVNTLVTHINPSNQTIPMENQGLGAGNPAGYEMQRMQQVHGLRNEEEEGVLVVEVDQPVLETPTRGRLYWTPELQRRFARAAEELGGYFKAKPKMILKKMNVRGVTRDQVKSHLQKVRNKALFHLPAAEEENINGGNTISDASQVSEDTEVYLDLTPFLEQDTSENEIQGSWEAANYGQNSLMVPVEDPPSSMKLEHVTASSHKENDGAHDGIAPEDNRLGNFPTQNDQHSSDFKFPALDLGLNENQNFGFVWDPVGNFMPNIQQGQYDYSNLRSAPAVDNARYIK